MTREEYKGVEEAKAAEEGLIHKINTEKAEEYTIVLLFISNLLFRNVLCFDVIFIAGGLLQNDVCAAICVTVNRLRETVHPPLAKKLRID